MSKKIVAAIIAIIFISCASNKYLVKNGNMYNFSTEKVNWILSFPADNFKLKSGFVDANGLSNFVLRDFNSGFNLYISCIGTNSGYCDTKTYLENKWENKKKSSPSAKNVKMTTTDESSILTYLVPEELNKGNIDVVYLKDDVFIDIYLSKLNFNAADNNYFANFFNSLKFIKKNYFIRYKSPLDSIAQTTLSYFKKGCCFYLKSNYQKSIVWYNKALEQEKENPTLEKKYWYVLIDNLGMAYGISGKPDIAKSIFEYGLSIDFTYPMYYYNRACAYAELNDLENCLVNLEKSFNYRKNMIQGETMPDPSTDISFKKYLDNERFQELLIKLKPLR
jgi:tetratricopeptide (TPR) repeat protein